MKEFKIREEYNLIYLGREEFNNCFWYHCILINNNTYEVELILDYKLDDEQNFYNLRTQPVKDFICWNIGNCYEYIKDIIKDCNIAMSKMVEELGDFKNER